MANTYLTRTFGSAGTRTKYTISVWVKRGAVGVNESIISAGTGVNNSCQISFNGADDRLYWNSYSNNGANYDYFLNCTRRFRDTSAWYHIVCAYDSTQGTASNRQKIYINGVQETAFATETYSSVNHADYAFNNILHEIGDDVANGSKFFNGSMSHFHGVDGTAYPASTFGSTDSTTGEWKINTSPSITMGTNGFTILKDGNTITDQSSNSNDFSLGGGTLTKTEDCPSNVFATWNPLNYVQANNSPVLTNGNTKMTGSADAPFPNAISTLGIPKSGKYYAEFKMQNNTAFAVGICDIPKGMDALRTASTQIYNTTFNGAVSLKNDGSVIRNGAETNSVTPTIATGDIAMIAYDADNGAFYAGRNGTWGTVGGVVGVPTSGSSKTGAIDISAQSWFTTSTDQGFLVGSPTGGGYAVIEANFGNGYFGTTAVTSAGTGASTPGTFEYAVPTSYQPLSTKGLNV